MTEEAGVWLGRCEGSSTALECTLTGGELYEGLQMTAEYNYEALKYKIRVIQLAD